MTEAQTIGEAFSQFNLSLDDLRKVLEAQYEGQGPNFLFAQTALAITEPIAKVFHPYRGSAIQTKLDDVDAKEAVHHLFSDCFLNPRYGQLSDLVWDCFRNGHVHLFPPKKVINVPLGRFDDSFLAGVHWSGMKPSELVRNPGDERTQRDEHLKFYIASVKGKDRPAFRFSPLIYYFDLKEAVEVLHSKVTADSTVRGTFLQGYQLLVNAKRHDFSGGKIRPEQKDLIMAELSAL